MSHKIDADVKGMTPARLRQEVMKLRTAIRKEVNHTGNRRCWVNLRAPLPEEAHVRPLSLPRCEFLRNCERYYDRNRRPRPADRETRRLLDEGRELGNQAARELGITRG
jgi:hypothetical protein